MVFALRVCVCTSGNTEFACLAGKQQPRVGIYKKERLSLSVQTVYFVSAFVEKEHFLKILYNRTEQVQKENWTARRPTNTNIS